MFKSIVSKNGDIKYFEVFKVVVLLSLFYLLLSEFYTHMTLTPTSNVITSLFTLLFIVQIIVVDIHSLVEIKDMIVSMFKLTFTMKEIELPVITVETIVSFFLPNKVTYQTLNVIRC